MILLVCLLGRALTVEAQQQVLAPPPAYSVAPPAVLENVTNQPGAQPVTALAENPEALPPWLTWGPVAVHPHALYRFLYGNGIQSLPGQTQNTAIQQFSPGVLFGLGNHWTLDYSPLFSFYSSSSFENTVDQNVALNWGTTYEDWKLGFSQTYSAVTAPLIETGTQTETDTYGTSATASYRFSSKFSTDLNIAQNFVFSPGFTDTRSWSTLDWLNYDAGERFDTGIGVGYEYDNVSPGPNMMSESAQGRVRWQAFDKLGFNVHGGFVVQQYLAGGAPNLITPIFGVAAQYHPFSKTSLSLTADRAVSPSLFQGQVTETTTVAATVNQRLLKRLNLTAIASYARNSYLASTSTPTINTGRADDYYSLSVRLGTTFYERGTASIFYQYSDNSSSVSAFSFSSSQAGVELEYRF